MNEIILIAPLADGNPGTPPDGNKNAVLNPTVATPTFSIHKTGAAGTTLLAGASLNFS